jgi:hypothetical protein
MTDICPADPFSVSWDAGDIHGNIVVWSHSAGRTQAVASKTGHIFTMAFSPYSEHTLAVGYGSICWWAVRCFLVCGYGIYVINV